MAAAATRSASRCAPARRCWAGIRPPDRGVYRARSRRPVRCAETVAAAQRLPLRGRDPGCAGGTCASGQLAAIELAPFRFQGWLGKRHTASFGWRYNFDDARFGPTEPIPAFLLPLRARAARFAGLAEADLVHALVARYDPGAGIGWHRDRPVFEHVVGISLETTATLRLRRRKPAGSAGGFDRAACLLTPGSVYALAGEARHEWEHSIVPGEARRWSVMFRSLSRGAVRR